MSYRFSLENFEGPLSLLDELVGSSGIDVTELDLAKVTDQYIAYLSQMKEFNVELASEFFLVASALIYIKTKCLLPSLNVLEEHPSDDSDRLLEHLNQYRKYRSFAKLFQEYWDSNRVLYLTRRSRNRLSSEDTVLSEITMGDLFDSIVRYKGIFEKQSIPLKKFYVPVEQKITQLMTMFIRKKTMQFSVIMFNEESKIDKIAMFLGITDMIYNQRLSCIQNVIFADFILFTKEK